MKQTHYLRQSFLLFLAALIWGVAFVAQRVGLDYIGPFAFNFIRCILGGLVLLPVIVLNKRKAGTAASGSQGSRRDLWIGGICCGCALCVASNLQQIGMMYTTVGKAGFITALYIIMVPILGIFLRKKVSASVWISVFLALFGLYLLCMKERLGLGKGELLVLGGAFVFSIHILVIDHFTELADGVCLSCIQFFTCGVFSGIVMLFTEHLTINGIWQAMIPLLYAGVMSCGVAYTLQIVGQRGMDPTVSSLILSMESVVSVLAGFVILHQSLSTREIAGCIVMFVAIVLAQLKKKGDSSGE